MLTLRNLLFISLLAVTLLPAYSEAVDPSPYIYATKYPGSSYTQWPNQQKWGQGYEWWRHGEIRFLWNKDISYHKPDMSKGSIDLIQSQNAGVWVEAYRLMNGLGMNAIDTPEKHPDTDDLPFSQKKEWLEQITPFIDTKKLKKDEYSFGDYPRKYNYPFALKILKERIDKLGKEHPYIKEWVTAQQAVFSNNNNHQFIPEPAITQAGDAPELIAIRLADRNYQIASAYFYGNILDKALEYYQKIENIPDSPYRKWAAYMVARTLLSQNNYDAAHEKIHTILKDDSLKDIYYATNGLLGVIANRSDNEGYQAENLQRFIPPLLIPANTAENNTFLAKHFSSLNNDLWYAINMYPVEGAEYLRKNNDFLDWLLTFKEQDLYVEGVEWYEPPMAKNSDRVEQPASNDMIEHALSKWRETGKIHWLVATMLRIPAEHAFAKDIIDIFQGITKKIEAGTATDEEQWAYPTLFHHAIRLIVANNQSNEAEKLLYNALEHKKEFAPRVAFHTVRYWLATGQNDRAKRLIDTVVLQEKDLNPEPFYLLRLALAESPIELITTGIKADYNKDRYSNATILGHANFIEPVANILNLLPIKTLKALSSKEEFPSHARAELALVAWTRAVLLERYDVADSLLPFLTTAIPELKNDFNLYKQATTAQDKHHAALILFLRNPRVKPFLNTDNYFRDEYYTKPGQSIYQYIDKFNHSNNNWWCAVDEAELLRTVSFSLYHAVIRNTGSRAFDFIDEEAPEITKSLQQSQQFIQSFKPLQLRDSDELKTLNALGAATTYLPKKTIAWANDRFGFFKYLDKNSTLSEALHRSVTVARYGCENDENKGSYSHQAFRILHRQFPINIWKKETPYWYQ